MSILEIKLPWDFYRGGKKADFRGTKLPRCGVRKDRGRGGKGAAEGAVKRVPRRV